MSFRGGAASLIPFTLTLHLISMLSTCSRQRARPRPLRRSETQIAGPTENSGGMRQKTHSNANEGKVQKKSETLTFWAERERVRSCERSTWETRLMHYLANVLTPPLAVWHSVMFQTSQTSWLFLENIFYRGSMCNTKTEVVHKADGKWYTVYTDFYSSVRFQDSSSSVSFDREHLRLPHHKW